MKYLLLKYLLISVAFITQYELSAQDLENGKYLLYSNYNNLNHRIYKYNDSLIIESRYDDKREVIKKKDVSFFEISRALKNIIFNEDEPPIFFKNQGLQINQIDQIVVTKEIGFDSDMVYIKKENISLELYQIINKILSKFDSMAEIILSCKKNTKVGKFNINIKSLMIKDNRLIFYLENKGDDFKLCNQSISTFEGVTSQSGLFIKYLKDDKIYGIDNSAFFPFCVGTIKKNQVVEINMTPHILKRKNKVKFFFIEKKCTGTGDPFGDSDSNCKDNIIESNIINYSIDFKK